MSGARWVRGLGLGFGLDLLVVLAAGAAPGLAQSTVATPTPPAATSGVPAREGNVWGHVAHQPTAAVGNAEQHAGVAPSAQQAQREDEELARINRQLQQQQGVKNPTSP